MQVYLRPDNDNENGGAPPLAAPDAHANILETRRMPALNGGDDDARLHQSYPTHAPVPLALLP